MISIRLSDLEGPIADRRLVALADTRTRERGLKRVGFRMRRWIRSGIKAAKRKRNGGYNSSSPGRTPKYRTEVVEGFDRDGRPRIKSYSKANNPFLRFLIYAYDRGTQSVVVGTRKLGSGPSMPRNLEFGGTSTVSVARFSHARHRVVGKSGEIRIGGSEGSTTWTAINTEIGDVSVTYAKLRTGRQAKRANRLNRRLYVPSDAGPPPPSGRVKVRTQARPYLRPAYKKFVEGGEAVKVIAEAAMESVGFSRRRRR